MFYYLGIKMVSDSWKLISNEIYSEKKKKTTTPGNINWEQRREKHEVVSGPKEK